MSVAAIRLTPTDNVAVCCRTVEPGEHILVDGHALTVTERVALGLWELISYQVPNIYQ